mmetsp:Transcript_46399/g.110556  ORF Transcript_46399/g.110556 Transcript_46399/m.110556 type:complete len:249 (-) Transcript_46399:7-753(-)
MAADRRPTMLAPTPQNKNAIRRPHGPTCVSTSMPQTKKYSKFFMRCCVLSWHIIDVRSWYARGSRRLRYRPCRRPSKYCFPHLSMAKKSALTATSASTIFALREAATITATTTRVALPGKMSTTTSAIANIHKRKRRCCSRFPCAPLPPTSAGLHGTPFSGVNASKLLRGRTLRHRSTSSPANSAPFLLPMWRPPTGLASLYAGSTSPPRGRARTPSIAIQWRSAPQINRHSAVMAIVNPWSFRSFRF